MLDIAYGIGREDKLAVHPEKDTPVQLLTRCCLGQRAFRQTYLTYGLRISIVSSLHLQTNAVGHLTLVLQRPVHIELADAPCILPLSPFKNRYAQFGIHHVIRVQI